jgi:hypothetical protein
LVTPAEVNHYLCHAAGISSLDSLTNIHYGKLTDIFDEKSFFIESVKLNQIKITQKSNPQKTLIIKANSNQILLNEQKRQTQTPAIYVDKTQIWYISGECLLLY